MEVICLDTSVMIEYYRKEKKEKSFLFRLAVHYHFKIPSVVKYEIYRGDKKDDDLWNVIFNSVEILPFDSQCAEIAAKIYKDLKLRNQLIESDDILIAATTMKNDLSLATFNKKHFDRINGLEIITPNDL